jgi:NAD(P)-dependent dehydrogenase (short-subunit alcohol dehydrogenase family)
MRQRILDSRKEETDMQFKDIPAIVTGGASGLGGATAELFAALGAKVTIFDLNDALGEAHAKKIGGHFAKVNVVDEASVEAGIVTAAAAHGAARILINCAGIGAAIKTVGKGLPHPMDSFRKVIEVNLLGTFNCISKVAAKMTELEPLGEERGVIVNTASVAAFDGQIGQAAYAASKGGVVGMTLPIARDLADKAVRVCTIAPGLFLTPLLMGLPEAARESLGKQVPFPSRLGHPSEYALLAKAIVENPMMNGEVIRLDGAIRMAPR